MNNNHIGLIIAAGGTSSRFSNTQNKLLALIDNQPVIYHTIKTFLTIIPQQNIIITIPKQYQPQFQQLLQQKNLNQIKLIIGGNSRQQSVYNGLLALPPHTTIAIIQDAARPYTSKKLILKCLEHAKKHGSAVAAKPVTDTIKIIDPNNHTVIKTPPRPQLWATETPQIFNKTKLITAYKKIIKNKQTATDDAQAMELNNQKVFLIQHNENNKKITFKIDLTKK